MDDIEDAMNSAKQYRQNAADCRRIAATMKRDEDRQTLLKIAEAWEKQAQEVERRTSKDDQVAT